MSFSSFDDWKIVNLGSICDVIDSLHKTPQYSSEGIPMIRVKDLYEGYFKISNPACVSREVYEEFSKKYKPKYGDILFSRVGSYGIASFVNTTEVFCLGQNTVGITNFITNVNNKFIYYSLISPYVKNQIEALVTGSTQKTISMKSINAFKIALPQIREQKAIAHILSTLDEKIEVNNRINEILENMAQAIYTHWFVDFEFPDENGNSYKSSGGKMAESELGEIPEGWEICNLEDISEVVMGQSPKGDTYNNDKIGLPLINGASDFKKGYINPLKYTSDPKKKSQPGDYVFGVRATVGNVTYVDKEYAIGRGVGIARSKLKSLNEFLYFVLVKGIKYLESTATGSVYINLSKDTSVA